MHVLGCRLEMIGRCMLDLPRSVSCCHANCCLCLHCFMPLKAAQVPRLLLNHSLSTVGGHRPRDRATGHGRMVIDQRWGHRLDIGSRPALKVADRPFLPAEHWFCRNRGQTMYGMEFASQMYTQPPSLSCYELKGVWLSTLGPPITHFDAWWPKEPSVHINVKWMHKTNGCHTLYHVGSRVTVTEDWGTFRHFKYETSLDPHVWFDTPNQTTMECMHAKCTVKHAITAMQHAQCNLKCKQHGNAISL